MKVSTRSTPGILEGTRDTGRIRELRAEIRAIIRGAFGLTPVEGPALTQAEVRKAHRARRQARLDAAAAWAKQEEVDRKDAVRDQLMAAERFRMKLERKRAVFPGE